MLWSGEKAWSGGERQMLCGLQLPGGGNEEQQVFKGRVADLDQSKVWKAGTCLGIDTTANQPTDVPIDCTGPHAMEVTGSVNVAEKFPGGAPPSETDQDAYIKETCTRMTDAYLAPVELRATTLTLVYSTISLPSWSAGSHQVSCSIGATLGNGGWATLVGSAKGPLLINGQPPVPPPDIPAERLNLPPIPLPMPTTIDTSGSQSQVPQQTVSPTNSAPTIGNQHLPNAPGPQTVDAPPPASPTQAPVPARRRRRSRSHRRRSGCRRRPPNPLRHHHRRQNQPPAASAMAVRMSPQRFDELVSDALDLIPPDLAAAIDNVVVLVDARHPAEPDLLGLYEGIALTERDTTYAGALPDTITIYRDALLDVCETENEVVDEVAVTVIHEIAHHFGIDDDRLHELGWA